MQQRFEDVRARCRRSARVELDTRDGPALDGGDDPPSWSTSATATPSAGSQANECAKYTSARRGRRGGRRARDPSVFQPMCGTRSARSRLTGPAQHTEAAAALVAFLEQQLHAEADAQHGPTRGDTFS
jgi:hypothetical protein